MTDYLTSLIRTAIPAAWGALVAWAVSTGVLPPELVEQAEGFAVVLTALAVIGWYALVRALETAPWFPRWAARLLLGSARPPVYLGTVPVGGSTPERP